MKSLKPILICAAIVLVMVLAYVIFAFVVPDAATPDTPDTTDESPTITTSSSNVYILENNYEDLRSMEFLPAEGESFRVDVDVSDDGNYIYDVTPATPYFTYATSLFRSLMYTVSKVSAKSEITEDKQPLSAYGLDNPWYTVRCTYADGTVTELYFGSQTVVDQNYYCMTNQSDSVYIIGSYSVQLMTRDELQYRDATLFTTYEGDDIYEKIDWIRLTKRDGTVIEVERDYDYDDEINVVSSAYIMRAPYVGSVNDDVFKSMVMDVVAPIEKVEILFDITEDEFAEYGLDKPARLEMTDVDGDSLNLLIGSTCENPLYTYAMIDGTYTVLVVESACLTWLDVKPIELFIRVGWLFNITDVASMDFSFRLERFAALYDGLEEHYEIAMTHGERVNGAGNTVKTVDATINGEPLSETNCRRLFIRALNMRIIDFLPEGTDLTAEPDAVISITTLDGKTTVMELVPINERDYAMMIDGKAEYYIYQKNLNNLITGLKENAMGYELENNYSAY